MAGLALGSIALYHTHDMREAMQQVTSAHAAALKEAMQ